MSSTAYLNLRHGVPERKRAFTSGLESLGFKVKLFSGEPKISQGDVFVTWNRIGKSDVIARKFEKKGCAVIVVENASWGNDFLGLHWYHIAKKYHNIKDAFPVGGPERWDNLCAPLSPWRISGETVILAQRGIGPAKVKMPVNFLKIARKEHPDARVRKHPGSRKGFIPLWDDLLTAGKIVTWGSGAAIKALMWGIPVKSYLPNWIGQQDNSDEGRLEMFRQLAWAQWTLGEIDSGEPFRRLL